MHPGDVIRVQQPSTVLINSLCPGYLTQEGIVMLYGLNVIATVPDFQGIAYKLEDRIEVTHQKLWNEVNLNIFDRLIAMRFGNPTVLHSNTILDQTYIGAIICDIAQRMLAGQSPMDVVAGLATATGWDPTLPSSQRGGYRPKWLWQAIRRLFQDWGSVKDRHGYRYPLPLSQYFALSGYSNLERTVQRYCDNNTPEIDYVIEVTVSLEGMLYEVAYCAAPPGTLRDII